MPTPEQAIMKNESLNNDPKGVSSQIPKTGGLLLVLLFGPLSSKNTFTTF